MRCLCCLLLLMSLGEIHAQTQLPIEEIDARLRHAFALGRETNNKLLVEDLLSSRDAITRAIERKDAPLIERLLREMEKEVGIDPGGKTMAGLPVSKFGFKELKHLGELNQRLELAMNASKQADLDATLSEITKLLGDRVGIPDSRRKGDQPKIIPLKPKDLAELFGRILDAEQGRLKVFGSGKPAPNLMARDYANIAQGCMAFRQLMQQEQPKRIPLLDGLIKGCCESLFALQMPSGFFKFPDQRGKHIRLGETIEQMVEQSVENVQDGWVVAEFPDGSSQYDAGEAGITLLRAGASLKNPKWTEAGLKAVQWAEKTPLVSTFNFNAYSVSLLCEAYRQTQKEEFRTAAWRKWKWGIAFGQAANGRWISPHDARTVYHLTILRAANDLLEISAKGPDRDQLTLSTQKAVKALLDEMDVIGIVYTSQTVQELSQVGDLAQITDPRLRNRLEQAASITHVRCIRDGVKAASPLPELAAIANVWK